MVSMLKEGAGAEEPLLTSTAAVSAAPRRAIPADKKYICVWLLTGNRAEVVNVTKVTQVEFFHHVAVGWG